MINGTRLQELEEVTRITPNIYVLIDSERKSKDEPIRKDRMDFRKCCETAGITCHITDRRATENYLTDSAVKKSMSQNFRSLGPYESLDQMESPKWGKNDMLRIAQEMSNDDWLETDVGQFLNTL